MTDPKTLDQLKDEWLAAKAACEAAESTYDDAIDAYHAAARSFEALLDVAHDASRAANAAYLAYHEALEAQENSND